MKKSLAIALSMMLMVLCLAPVAQAAPVEIDYWSVFTGADGATMQGMVDAFNASQDEVHVNHTPVSYTHLDVYKRQAASSLSHGLCSMSEREGRAWRKLPTSGRSYIKIWWTQGAARRRRLNAWP